MSELGRPAKYDTPEALEAAIDSYFEGCTAEPLTFNGEVLRDAKGNVQMAFKVPTTAGLALHLGYADRQSLYDQKGRSEAFSCIIKRAITAIEVKHEEAMLTSSSPTGSIFWLKNHKWVDKQSVDLADTTKRIDTSKLTKEQQDALAAIAVQSMNIESITPDDQS